MWLLHWLSTECTPCLPGCAAVALAWLWCWWWLLILINWRTIVRQHLLCMLLQLLCMLRYWFSPSECVWMVVGVLAQSCASWPEFIIVCRFLAYLSPSDFLSTNHAVHGKFVIIVMNSCFYTHIFIDFTHELSFCKCIHRIWQNLLYSLN